MKIAMLVYHRNAKNLYPPHWLQRFKESIDNQTYNRFTIYELDYSGKSEYRIFENSKYESIELPTFVDAMNYLLDKCFSAGYDYCLNNNVDDYAAITRVEKQLEYMEKGYDVIAANFALVRDDQIIHTHHFDQLDIARELSLSNNILCHPCISWSKNLWQHNRYVPSEIPAEDLLLWKRAIDKGNTFIILPEVLCFHRLHNNSVCQNENNR